MIALLAALLTGPALAQEVPLADVSGIDDWVVLDDGAGHLIAFSQGKPRDGVWYGDKEHLYALQIVGSGASGSESWNVTAMDFRSDTRKAYVNMRDGVYTMSCGNDLKATLAPLSKAEAKGIVSKAAFHVYRWRRNAVGAWRDEYGVYYFVDRATGEDLNADHRVYIGWQGQILRAPLKLLASDSLGRVYSAGNGTRRLVITKDKARYIEREETRELHALDLYMDGPFLYTDLGIYGDAPHGTPCDALLPLAE